ncbi:MAG: SGNH/GDSL hydrolase family protein [Polyangiaceae bacterium]
MSARRGLAGAVAASALTLVAQAGAAPVSVIEPGQEDALADMLGRGAELPAGCAWAGADIEANRVVSRYGCAGRAVAVELCHPIEGACVPRAKATTSVFALAPFEDSRPPSELVEALSKRVEAKRGTFRWSQAETPPGSSEAQRSARPMQGVLFAIFGAAMAAMVGGLGVTWLARRPRVENAIADAIAKSRLGPGAVKTLRLATGALLSVGLAFALFSVSRAAAALLADWLLQQPFARVSVRLAIASGLTAMSLALLGRLATPKWLVGGVVALLAIGGYRASLLSDDLHHFGALSTPDPSSEGRDPSRSVLRARPMYEVNRSGFRGPEWSLEKAAGVFRVVLIGDSFVAGDGLPDWESTLGVRVERTLAERHEDKRVEVLNLGLPGDNIVSHVNLYREAATQLDADAIVVCLTLLNDLSAWDGQTERRDARRLSVFSVVRFLVGDAAVPIYSHVTQPKRVTQKEVALFQREMARLGQLHRELAADRALVVFTYGAPPVELDPFITPEGATRAPVETPKADFFIPNDGHPTALGNEHFGRAIADALDADERARTRMSASRP